MIERLRAWLRRLLVRNFVLDAVNDVRVRRIILDEAAYRIRAELVCCYVYERHADAGTYVEEEHHHALCYWGEASARLAEDTVHSRRTAPAVG